jgi:hypothetical protein
MRLLRTAAGGFINAAKIVRLADEREQAESWVAILDDGDEVALAPYYSAPGRIERDLPDLSPKAGRRPMPDARRLLCWDLLLRAVTSRAAA